MPIPAMTEAALPLLSAVEARVLGVLVEKELSTPDYYPLTLNALAAGCNQKTSRYPVMNIQDAELQDALDSLKRQTLVIETTGASGRVMRYAHNVPKGLAVPTAMAALLAGLMLRGPQTAAELRANCERLYRFADLSSVEAYLADMASRRNGALVTKLARQPGSRENRWAHLLCGMPKTDATHETTTSEGGGADIASLQADLALLRQEVVEIRQLVERLCVDLNIPRPDH